MIRTYRPADHGALVDLFARAGADSPSGELWGHLPSERMVHLVHRSTPTACLVLRARVRP